MSESTYVIVMVAPHIVRQFVTQDPPHFFIRPETFVVICPQPELDSLARIDVESQQLRMLRQLGLVVGERAGRQVIYTLHDDHVAALLSEAVFHTEHRRLQAASPLGGARSA